jgi:hypothetical protein
MKGSPSGVGDLVVDADGDGGGGASTAPASYPADPLDGAEELVESWSSSWLLPEETEEFARSHPGRNSVVVAHELRWDLRISSLYLPFLFLCHGC